jgi:hypothetical protein
MGGQREGNLTKVLFEKKNNPCLAEWCTLDFSLICGMTVKK